MRRVLLIAYFFPPLGGGGCQRTLKLVRYLEPIGWASTVVTTRDRDYWILDPSLLDEVPPSAELLRVGGFTALRALRLLARTGAAVEDSRGMRRRGVFRALRALQRWVLIPDGYAGWARAARQEAARRVQAGGVDALWTTSSPESAHLAGLALKRDLGLPWVADFRDPWVGRATYGPPTRWHDLRHRALEREVVRRADRITLVSEAMVDLYRDRYPEVDRARFVFLPNGFDSDDWRRASRAAPEEPEAAGPDRGRFVLLHAGQLAHRPTVRTLLHAAGRVIERDPAAAGRLTLRFLGGNEELSPRETERFGLGRALEILPPRPHLEALAAMRRASALVLLGHGGRADGLLYTGKIYEYLSSGRPVLGLLEDGPGAALIRAAGAGPVLGPDDIEGVAGAIGHWLTRWRAGQDLSIRPPERLLSTWERHRTAEKAASILTEIAAPDAR